MSFEQIQLWLITYILLGAGTFIAAVFLLVRDKTLAAIISFAGLLLLAYGTFYIAFSLAFEL